MSLDLEVGPRSDEGPDYVHGFTFGDARSHVPFFMVAVLRVVGFSVHSSIPFIFYFPA
jgi:hypothetical protein